MDVATATDATVVSQTVPLLLGNPPWEYLLTKCLCSEISLQLVSYFTVELNQSMNAPGNNTCYDEVESLSEKPTGDAI